MKKVIFLFAALLLIGAKSFSQPLTGVYTIGGINPSFSTIDSAFRALDSNGVGGSVVFNIRDGVYQEQLSLTNVTGASAANRITFQSESLDSSLVVISTNGGSNNNYTLKINADFVSFKHLTLEAVNQQYSGVIDYTWADYFRLENCVVRGTSCTTNCFFSSKVLMNRTNGRNHGFEVRNCVFLNGAIGLIGSGISSSAGGLGLDYVIENNLFFRQEYRGLEVDDLGDYLIRKNVFISRDTINNGRTALFLDDNCVSGIVEQNEIKDYMGTGIVGRISNSVVKNNFISITSIQNSPHSGTGMSVSGSGNKVLNNTVVIQPGVDGFSTCFRIISGSAYTEVKNNIFANLDTSLIISVGGNYGTLFRCEIDNNVLFSDGTNKFSEGRFTNNFMHTLASWNQLTGYDSSSTFVKPNFLFPGNLHLSAVNSFIGTGIIDTNVRNDFDGELRGSTNDIGADQYSPFLLDLELKDLYYEIKNCDTATSRISWRNLGSDTIHSLVINWQINGGAPQSKIWSGSIPSGDSIKDYKVSEIHLFPDSNYVFTYWLSNPNTQTDYFLNNDSLQVNYYNPSDQDSIQYVKVCEGDTTTLTLSRNYSSYLWRGGDTNSTIQVDTAGIYAVMATDNRDCIVEDSLIVSFYSTPTQPTIFQNGTFLLSSAAFGNQWYLNSAVLIGDTFQIINTTTQGYYQVRAANKNGCSNISDSLSTLTTRLDYEDNQALIAVLSPNPADQYLTIKLAFNEAWRLSIVSLQGKVLVSELVHSNDFKLDVNQFSSGLYFLRIEAKGFRKEQKLLIQH